MRNKAYSYIRFSTADQIKGDSQRRQTEQAAAWCKANDVELVESYHDLGVSAFRGKNAAQGSLGAFLSLVNTGRIPHGSFLLVESLDRLSRAEIMTAFDQFRAIIKAGVCIVTVSDGHIYTADKLNSNFTDLLISLTVMSRAHEESKIKSQRISAAWVSKRRAASSTPMTARCVAWCKLAADRKRFELIPERAAIVREIFERAAKGHGTYSTAKELRRRNVPCFGKSSTWHVSYIKKILCNRSCIGEFSPGKMTNQKREQLDALVGYYPAVVTPEMFSTVQQRRKNRPSLNGRSSFNVFSKLAFDEATGSPLCYVNKCRSKGWHYLVPAAAIAGKTSFGGWQYDRFKIQFLVACGQLVLQKPAAVAENEIELSTVQCNLDALDRRLSRLVAFLESGEGEAVGQRLRELEAERKQLQGKQADIQSRKLDAPTDAALVDWTDDAALRDNLLRCVKRITVNIQQLSFTAEFYDGRKITCEPKKWDLAFLQKSNP